MPEVRIVYRKSKTLELLKSLATFFEFEVVPPKTKSKQPVKKLKDFEGFIPRNADANIEDLSKILTGKNINAKDLRRAAWERKK